jgi:hypothetical protein
MFLRILIRRCLNISVLCRVGGEVRENYILGLLNGGVMKERIHLRTQSAGIYALFKG